MVVALPPVRLSSAALAESSLRSSRKREVTMEVRLDRVMRDVVYPCPGEEGVLTRL